MAFPLSFGFVPDTRAQDGDPVDILVLSDEDLPVGTLVTAPSNQVHPLVSRAG
jgi:inorganic pyrophosphatase